MTRFPLDKHSLALYFMLLSSDSHLTINKPIIYE